MYEINKKIVTKQEKVENSWRRLFRKLQRMVFPFENIKNICYLSGTEVLRKLKLGEVTPVHILEAYQAKALLENIEINFISEVISDADVFALSLPNKSQSLMGWPLSVKDTFCIEQYDCSQGLYYNILKPCSKNSVIINVLKEGGAIPFLITNVSQGLQTMETNNPLFGRTLNPINHRMTCGGSSGGEGAALASQSSLIGLGNDAGGSIRIPASYCGIYGLKPTSSRVSSRHTNTVFFCNFIIKTSIGPMARYIDDLIATFKVMISDKAFELDSYTPPIPFNETLLLSISRLKIGYYTDIGGQQVRLVPAVDRAVMMAKSALERCGYELVPFSLPNIDTIANVIAKAFIIDGGKRLVNEALAVGPVDPSLRFSVRLHRMPRFIKFILSRICWVFDKPLSRYISETNGSTVFETWKLNDNVMTYREDVLTLLERNGIDGIICAVLPIAAPPHNTCNELAGVDIYCTIYNVLDYPAGSVPVTVVCDEDLRKLSSLYPNKSSMDRKILEVQKDSLGLPVGVQCVAKPWRDETCLRIMRDLSNNLC